MKKKPTTRRAGEIVAMIVCVGGGAVAGWWLHGVMPRAADSHASGEAVVSSESVPVLLSGSGQTHAPIATSGAPTDATDVLKELHRRHLRAPIDGVDPASFKSAFQERRGGVSGHSHEAVDILALRGTPVHAVDAGTIAKLFYSKAGGNTIYQFDPTGRFCYYYAHLERYADGVHEGQPIAVGDVIGYVGTSGNAPPQTPHLHFTIFELGPDKRWWQGTPIDPYLVFSRR